VLDELAAAAKLNELKDRLAALETERDEYKRLYVALLEAYRKLEAGLVGQKRERFVAEDAVQLALSLMSMLVGNQPPSLETQQVEAHERRKPTGRKVLPENLPRIEVEVIPPEVQRRGLDAFERIGKETTETVERRPASAVVVRTIRPKYVLKEAEADTAAVVQAPAVELPIPRSIAGPGQGAAGRTQPASTT